MINIQDLLKTPSKRGNIFIADDNNVVLETFVKVLETDHNTLGTARNRNKLVDFVMQSNPEIIFINLDIPLLDGLEANRKLLGLGNHASVIINSDNLHRLIGKQGFKVKTIFYDIVNSTTSPWEYLTNPDIRHSYAMWKLYNNKGIIRMVDHVKSHSFDQFSDLAKFEIKD